ncbi:hypothetical protein [Solicola sp. PLA-1-18]|uniref:ATP dependent DNA ligase n=1 Tax=Solicola sp. PLA-1-18 TaxID=3380532 RepID=UPI003B760F7F
MDAPATVIASRLVLLGEPDGPGMRYVGFVRLGPREEAASRLGEGLEGVEVDDCPFVDPPEVSGAHWCRSGLAVTVRFDGRNAIGRLRMPSLEVVAPRERTGEIDVGARSAGSAATRG